jgi:hypothetical protein
MLKKFIVTSAAGLLLVGFFFGRDAASYVRTSLGWVKSSVQESVPVKFQIERAKKMIDGIEPEVYRSKSLVVREEVAIEQLAKRIADLDKRLADDKANILKMKTDLESGERYIRYVGRVYTSDQVKVDLSNRFRRFKTNNDELNHLRNELEARQKTLDAAREKLEAMLAARTQLSAEISRLEAQETMIEVAKSSSHLAAQVDDSQLAATMQLIRDISARLEVEHRMLGSDIEFEAHIPMEEPPSGNLTEEIAEYFSGDRLDPSALAAEAEIASDAQL